MNEAEVVLPESETIRTQNLVSDILKGELPEGEKAVIAEKRRFYESAEGDLAVFDSIEKLREEVEPIDRWKEVSAKADKEINDLPADILEKLLERFSPYIKSMPAGHSRGHYLRDTVNFTSLLHDPEMKNYRKSEVVAGLLAGVGHDIGTSVVSRYDDGVRFSGHGEVGAHVFGEEAKDILPPNLLKMAQIGIAAHTHYTKDLTISREGQERTRRQYDDKVDDGHKMSMWMARWADRLDTRGPYHVVRHILTKAMPTSDYTGEEFERIPDDDVADFKSHFQTKREKPDVLWHLMLFADSDFKDPPLYNLHDTPYMTNELFGPEDRRQMDFIDEVEDHHDKLKTMSDDQKRELRASGFEAFYKLSRRLEPAEDTDRQIEILQRKFGMLSEDEQAHWAQGFDTLSNNIYPRSYAQKKEHIRNQPDVAAVSQGKDSIGAHLHTLANEVWSRFTPEVTQ